MPRFGPEGEQIGYVLYEHPKDAPTIVLFHGFTSSSASWIENLDGLRAHFTVLTIDLLGHGDSDAPSDPLLYDADHACRRILQLFDELGVEDALVCGHSLGGALALRLALEAPERVAGLVVENSNSAAGTESWREESQPQLDRFASRLRTEGTAFLRETRYYPGRSIRLSDDARDALTADFERLAPEGVAGTAEQLVARIDVYERLGELKVPALIVVGDRDVDFVHNAPRLVAAIRGAKVEMATLHAAGHNAHLEQPEAFNEEVVRFAREIEFLAPLTTAQRWRRPASVAALFLIGWAAIAYGSWMLVRSDSSAASPAVTPTQARAAAPGTPGAPSADTTRVAVAPAATSPTSLPPTQSPSQAAASATAGATATPAPPATPTATLQVTRQNQDSPTPTAINPTPRPTATPTPTEEPTPTETPAPTATPSATPTPSGPSVNVVCPSTTSVGVTITCRAITSGNPDKVDWDWGAGTKNSTAVVPISFPDSKCYTVTATAYFLSMKPPQKLSASTVVAVGNITCH